MFSDLGEPTLSLLLTSLERSIGEWGGGEDSSLLLAAATSSPGVAAKDKCFLSDQ